MSQHHSIGTIGCVATLLVLAVLGIIWGPVAVMPGAASGMGEFEASHATDTLQSGQEPNVTITSPTPNETFNRTEVVRIDLAFENTDTATVTVGNRTDPQNFEVHVTVRDTNGDGTATVYLNPFQLGDGAFTDCGPDVPFDDCEAIVSDNRSRNHGFHTAPGDEGSALVGPAGAQAVADGSVLDIRGGSYGTAVIYPLAYDLAVTSGTDTYRQTGADDTGVLELGFNELEDLRLWRAPRTGEAFDPATLDDVRDGIATGTVEPAGENATISDDEYAIFEVNATGLGGILHEAAVQHGTENASELLVGQRTNVTDAGRYALNRSFGGMQAVDLSVQTPGPYDVALDVGRSVEQIFAAGRDYDRLYVVLSPESGRAVTTNESELASGMRLETSFTLDTDFALRMSVPELDATENNVTWEFAGPDSRSVSAVLNQLPENVVVGEQIRFDAGQSEGLIGTYEWEFGDGKTATGQTVWHTYDEPGEYTVELQVTGPDDVDSTTATITVAEAPGTEPSPDGTPTGGGTVTGESATDTPGETPTASDADGSGFGVLLAIVGPVVLAVRAVRKRERAS